MTPKRMIVAGFAVLLFTMGYASCALAYTCNASGCTWETGYTEPSTLSNGQAITDLQSCIASYKTSVDGGSPSATPKTFTIAASKPAGGGVIKFNFTDATMVPGHTYAISETVKCVSTSFGTGSDSLPAALPMNNGVAPSQIPSVTVQ